MKKPEGRKGGFLKKNRGRFAMREGVVRWQAGGFFWVLGPANAGRSTRMGNRKGISRRGADAEGGRRGAPNCAAFYLIILTRHESACGTENRDF